MFNAFVILLAYFIVGIILMWAFDKAALLGKKKPKSLDIKLKDDYKDYRIEFYPISGKYYALYKNKYLYQWNSTGRIDQRDDPVWATSCNTKVQAQRLIDIHNEYRTKSTVINIPIK